MESLAAIAAAAQPILSVATEVNAVRQKGTSVYEEERSPEGQSHMITTYRQLREGIRRGSLYLGGLDY